MFGLDVDIGPAGGFASGLCALLPPTGFQKER